MTQQQINLAEIYSQCWDDEDFKEEFKADPKGIMKKYGVIYDDNIDYVVMDSEPKTITYVLPFNGVKETMDQIADSFKDKVKDVVEGKQIIPENWCIKLIQNTEDTEYIVIPMSPENLTPEELEFVNGCAAFFAGIVFIAGIYFLLGVVAVVAAAAAVAIKVGLWVQAVGQVQVALHLQAVAKVQLVIKTQLYVE